MNNSISMFVIEAQVQIKNKEMAKIKYTEGGYQECGKTHGSELKQQKSKIQRAFIQLSS